jgi:hypothetical protein
VASSCLDKSVAFRYKKLTGQTNTSILNIALLSSLPTKEVETISYSESTLQFSQETWNLQKGDQFGNLDEKLYREKMIFLQKFFLD